MPKIARIRPVLLTAPYASPKSLEVQICLPHGYKTTGLVEVTLDDGSTGVGEGYLGVFAPKVFAALVELVGAQMIGREGSAIQARYRDCCAICDYWSLQGAARHVTGAIEIALIDAAAKRLGVPAYALLGGRTVDSIPLYGSGGDSTNPDDMAAEVALLKRKGIGLFKIRARNHQVGKTVWTLNHAAKQGIGVAVDMIQNLINPAQSVGEVVRFVEAVGRQTDQPIAFLEEALGPADIGSYPALRSKVNVRVAGGEIVTTATELCDRVHRKCYDIAQPDATVIGGMMQAMEVVSACRQEGVEAVVHCWGSSVGMLANYHVAFAAGSRLVEWPMPEYPLRQALLAEPLRMDGGILQAPTQPGIGVRLTPEVERAFAFREEAVYNCLTVGLPWAPEPDWQKDI